jgi:hypothetical protein
MICSDLNCLLANEIPPFFIVQSNIIAGLVFGGQVMELGVSSQTGVRYPSNAGYQLLAKVCKT